MLRAGDKRSGDDVCLGMCGVDTEGESVDVRLFVYGNSSEDCLCALVVEESAGRHQRCTYAGVVGGAVNDTDENVVIKL